MNKVAFTITIIGALMTIGGLFKLYTSEKNTNDLLTIQIFGAWKEKHTKAYSSYVEEQYRLGVFQKNMHYVKTMNNLDKEVTLGASQFADLTTEEFKNFLTFKPKTQTKPKYLTLGDAPATLDWRTGGAVTSVKNQKKCGGCWAFAAAGAMESAYFLKTKKLQDFSVQQLIDCSHERSSKGCHGGDPRGAMLYVAKNSIERDNDYKFTGKAGECASDNANSITDLHIKGPIEVPQADSDQLKAYLLKTPVTGAIDATVLQFYMFGVVNWLPCDGELNHAVLLVGYDTTYFGTPYWIIKNSYGHNWGESGYFRIRRDSGKGVGKCGITEACEIPDIE